MKNKRTIKLNDGFTLVEVIVVLTILTVLATVMIPSLTGYIDKANNGAAITECRNCVLAAQALASEHYAFRETLTIDDKDEIVALAESPAGCALTELEVDNGILKRMVFRSSSGRTVTYADRVYTVDGTSVGGAVGGTGGGGTGGGATPPPLDLSNGDTLNIMRAVFSTSSGDVNSGEASFDGSNANVVKAALAAAGVDLDTLDAKAWQYDSQTNRFFYWTTQDISGLSAGTKIPVMRYNFTSGTYTVWYATISGGTFDGHAYKAFAKNKTAYEPSTKPLGVPASEVSSVQTYENMLQHYANAVAGT